MPSLLKKSTEVENIESQVEAVRAEVEERNITQVESEAIISQIEAEKEKGASTKKLEKATALISGMFNLDDSYSVVSFADKGSKLKITLENSDFTLAVDIKKADRHGLIDED